MVTQGKLHESKDKGEQFGPFFTDISKEFDWIDYNPLITKLSWCRVTPKSFNLIFFYLSKRSEGVRMHNSYSKKKLY